MKRLELSPGTVFARDYRIVRALAEGGMGAVYVAEQLSTGKERALKVLLPGVVDDARNRESFALEARVGSRIESDHVVEVVGAGVDDETGAPWLAMELLRGESLGDRVRRRGALPRDEVAALFDQLGDALSKAHRAGVVHRDLKPENLFVAESRIRGVAFVLKVLDFGIARLIAQDRTAATSTRAIGSPLWLAPEQAQTGARIKPATDVWALGLLAFYALTGKAYWRAGNAEEFNVTALLMEVAVNALPSASERAAELGVAALVPAGFDAWFARCVARDADARFADAGEAVAPLLALLGTAPSMPETRPLSATPAVARTEAIAAAPPSPHVASTVPVQTVAVQGLGGAGMPVHPSFAAPPAHPSPEVKGSSGMLVPAILGVATLAAAGVWWAQRSPSPVATASVATEAPAPSEPAAVVGDGDGDGDGAPIEARVREPTSPDPRGGRFTLDEATEGVTGSGRLMANVNTSRGLVRCALDEAQAPNTVANFVGLARGRREFWDPVAAQWTRRPFYDGSIFHRVIPGFMIQGGDLLRSGTGGTGYEIRDENVMGHDAPGLLCMANHGPNTNGGQFFITDASTPHLDGSYSIFGRCAPTELVHEIASAPRGQSDRPERPVFIRSVTVYRAP